MKNIVIYGASGYVGQELLKLSVNHPEVNISGLSANSSVGQDIDFELKDKRKTKIKFENFENIDLSNVDFIFNCLPNGQMHKAINNIDKDIRIIDLSIDSGSVDVVKYFESKFTKDLKDLSKKEIAVDENKSPFKNLVKKGILAKRAHVSSEFELTNVSNYLN